MYSNEIHATGRLYRIATLLALVTIGYNLLEGVVSVWLGAEDETLSLLGFGLDSFVEVVSGAGIWHMIRRQQQGSEEQRDGFEQRALRITGTSFFLLAAGLVVTAGLNLYKGHQPVTTIWGIVIALISICIMWLLLREKTAVGKALRSAAILADASCTRVCMLLSGTLLLSSIGYELSGIGQLDAIGSMVIAWLSFQEGREAYAKARGETCSCSCSCNEKC